MLLFDVQISEIRAVLYSYIIVLLSEYLADASVDSWNPFKLMTISSEYPHTFLEVVIVLYQVFVVHTFLLCVCMLLMCIA